MLKKIVLKAELLTIKNIYSKPAFFIFYFKPVQTEAEGLHKGQTYKSYKRLEEI
jgi:hypothetical protein